MTNPAPLLATCAVCQKKIKMPQAVPAEMVRNGIAEHIQRKFPDWHNGSFICREDLNRYRTLYVQDVLEDEKGELSALDLQVLTSLKEEELLSRNMNVEFDRQLSLGERLADRVATFGGSWVFIIFFGCVLFIWIMINTVLLSSRPFDPYPFILLNLILSCIAALQAPIIMMSQNRQEAKDRLRSEHDYLINLKAELEIRHLNEKIDHLLRHQWQRLLEIQQIQMEIMEESPRRKTPVTPPMS